MVDARELHLDALLPAEMAAKAEEIGVKKARLDTLSTFTLRGTAITGLRVSQSTYSLDGATRLSTEWRSPHALEYLLWTIRYFFLPAMVSALSS